MVVADVFIFLKYFIIAIMAISIIHSEKRQEMEWGALQQPVVFFSSKDELYSITL